MNIKTSAPELGDENIGLFAFDLTGKPLWSRDLGRIISRLGWGEAVTPVIHSNSLLLNWDQEANSKLISSGLLPA